jgi:hypothetical protein
MDSLQSQTIVVMIMSFLQPLTNFVEKEKTGKKEMLNGFRTA